MCAIIFTNNKEIAVIEDIYNVNSRRGELATGYYTSEEYDLKYGDYEYYGVSEINKHEGMLNNELLAKDGLNIIHCQSPTSDVREWSFDNAHPFTYGKWVVFHNGVITNEDELKYKIINYNYNINIDRCSVDSCLIPLLLHSFGIEDTLNSIKGTFGLCIVDNNIIRGESLKYPKIYFARQGSPLWHSEDGQVISTISTEINNVEMSEGIVYRWNHNKPLSQELTFTNKTPYFTL
tara:strand:+ start:39252 stop:39956 length:705 start_codon:yes stop_codon:yes gene_type:complete